MERVRAWRPALAGVSEVLHAHFTEHSYPAHVHEHWTVLLVDSGGVDYTLDRTRQQAVAGRVTVLPPYVCHDGRAASPGGFDKRVLYVDDRWLPERLTGAALRSPTLTDPALARAVSELHEVLDSPGDELEAESRLALVAQRITAHLDPIAQPAARTAATPAWRGWCGTGSTTTRRASSGSPASSARTRRTWCGSSAASTASRRTATSSAAGSTGPARCCSPACRSRRSPTATGFHDQSHLTRHFRALLGTTPGAFRSAA